MYPNEEETRQVSNLIYRNAIRVSAYRLIAEAQDLDEMSVWSTPRGSILQALTGDYSEAVRDEEKASFKQEAINSIIAALEGTPFSRIDTGE